MQKASEAYRELAPICCLPAFPLSYFSSSSTPVMPDTHIHMSFSVFDVRNQEIGFYRRYSGAVLKIVYFGIAFEAKYKSFLAISIPMTKVNSCCVYVRYTLFRFVPPFAPSPLLLLLARKRISQVVERRRKISSTTATVWAHR